MKRTFKVLVLGTTLLLTSQVFAQKKVAPSFASSTQHEVDLTMTHVTYEAYRTDERNTDVSIYGGYSYQINANAQVGGEGGFIPVPDGANTKTTYAILATYTYNFDTPIRQGFFVQGGAGMYPAYDKDDREYDSQGSAFAGGGFRYEVWGKINYKPYIRVWKRGEEDVRYEVELLSFSIFY